MGMIILLAAIGFALVCIGFIIRYVDDSADWEICFVFAVFFLIAAIICGCFAWHEYAYKDLTAEIYRNKYTALKLQLDDGYYDRITYDGRQALMNHIVKYNEDVIRGRAKHKSEWIGAFYPEDWDSLPLIALEGEQ